ncbi:vascular endothelial zinc finger 1-like [Contarinia nasturtii]|uniref:vascular endothelial zinc finger 1-like n=1 Tax=Contarinia nasturtii TaxID=265458 RepID=UPI0012D3A771|nr:vascular endothelial zinc finger 1-like [Contarinia nasturtii]
MNRSGRPFDDEFQSYFHRTLNERLASIYARIEMELVMDPQIAQNAELYRNGISTTSSIGTPDQRQSPASVQTEDFIREQTTFYRKVDADNGSILGVFEERTTTITRQTNDSDSEIDALSEAEHFSAEPIVEYPDEDKQGGNGTLSPILIDDKSNDGILKNTAGVTDVNGDGSIEDEANRTIKATKLKRSKKVPTKIRSAKKSPIIHRCDQCNYATSRIGHFYRHKLTHTDQKPYQCHRCFKNFNRSDNMKSHMKLFCKKKSS